MKSYSQEIKCLIIGCLLLFLPNLGLGQDRPNILWLTFEDTSPQFIGCYGNIHAETPVMDKLAEQGIRFTSAFSKGTVCSPSRSAIITGVPTYKLGSGNHRSSFPIPDFIKGFPEYLKNAGYFVTNNSKTDYNIAGMREFVSETWNESSDKAGWWDRKPGQPFFSVFNIPDSHQSRTMSMSYEWYEKNVLKYLEPEQMPNQNEDREIAQDKRLKVPLQKEFSGLHEKKVIPDSAFVMPPIYRDSDAMRKQMARVYNSIKLTDLKMGDILQRLKDEGLLEETIVFIFADHGEGMPRAKTNGIGLGYRVPFIIWFPEKYKHLSPWGAGGIVTDELIDFEDLAPTILSLAGCAIPEYMNGRPLIEESRKEPPEYTLLSSDRADNGLDMVRTITDGQYVYSRNFMPFIPELKYIRYVEIGEITQQMRKDYQNGKLNETQSKMFEKRPVEVLYDLKSDSWETENLAGKEEFEDIFLEMRDRLETQILKERDVHFVPEYELGEISKLGTPYEFRLDEQKYPLIDIYKTANLVGKDDSENLFKSLKSQNRFIRYWASLGLYSMKSKLNNSQLEKIKDGLLDEYPPVQINLAALLYTENQDKEAEDVLKGFISSPNEHLALSAINYTLYFDNRSAFITAVKEVYASEIGYKVKAAALDFLDLEGLVPGDKQN